jgi:hypothetical protein
MSSSELDITPGKYRLNSLRLTNYEGEVVDISGIISSFEVTETINSLASLYSFVVVDGVNLLERYYISGNEKLELVIEKKDTPNSNEELVIKNLVLSGIKSYSRPSNEGQVYTIKAVTETSFALSSKRVSRSVTGTSTSIISDLYSDISSELNVIDSSADGNFKAVLPNYTYADTIKLLLLKAQKANGSPFYLYETLWGDSILNSYDTMISSRSFDTFKQLSEDKGDTFSYESYDINRTRINSVSSDLGFSHFEGIRNGAYFCRTHALDYSKKEYRSTDYSIFDSDIPKIDSDSILQRGFSIAGNSLSDYPDAKQFFISENSLSFGEGVDNLNNRFEASVSKKAMVTNNQFAITHNISINGDTRVKPGVCIDIELPPAGDPELLQEIEKDDLLSGKFLVTSVVHKFDKDNNYSQTVSLRKDSIDFNMLRAKY